MQRIPRSEFRKRRDYWRLWKQANDQEAGEYEHPDAPGVSVKETTDLPDGARIIEG